MHSEHSRSGSVVVLMSDKHMGNLVMSLTAIKALRDFYRDRKVFLVVDSAYGEIAEALSWIDTVMLYPRKQVRNSSLTKRALIFLDFCRQIRRASADILIDLDGRHASALITLLSGAETKVGRTSADNPHFYNFRVRITEGKHKVHTYLDMASALGAAADSIEFQTTIPERRRQSVKDILRSEGLSMERPFVCMHPGAGKIYKQWTASGFAQVSDWLTGQGYQTVFIGNGKDAKKTGQVLSLIKRPAYDLTNKLSLGELMALFEQCSLYIGNDSGPMHLADRAGMPLVALFGPADEKRWGPASNCSTVVRGEAPCAKCKGKDCQYDFKCILTLTVDEVQNAVLKVMSCKEPYERSG